MVSFPPTLASQTNPLYVAMKPSTLKPSAASRSTRMIIETASYSTTPSYTPPSGASHTFSATDHHNALPTVEALEAAAQALERSLQERKLENSHQPVRMPVGIPDIKISPSSDCYRTAVAAAAAKQAKETLTQTSGRKVEDVKEQSS